MGFEVSEKERQGESAGRETEPERAESAISSGETERRGRARSGFEASEKRKGRVNLPGEKLNLSVPSLQSAVVKLSAKVGHDRLS